MRVAESSSKQHCVSSCVRSIRLSKVCSEEVSPRRGRRRSILMWQSDCVGHGISLGVAWQMRPSQSTPDGPVPVLGRAEKRRGVGRSEFRRFDRARRGHAMERERHSRRPTGSVGVQSGSWSRFGQMRGQRGYSRPTPVRARDALYFP